MGSKTYYSIPENYRPLSMRYNIVITNNPDKHIETNSFLKFTNYLHINNVISEIPFFYKKKIFIIGGAEIYNLLGKQCNTMYITNIKGDYGCNLKLDIKKFISNFQEKYTLVEKANYKIIKYSKPVHFDNSIQTIMFMSSYVPNLSCVFPSTSK